MFKVFFFNKVRKCVIKDGHVGRCKDGHVWADVRTGMWADVVSSEYKTDVKYTYIGITQ